MRIIGITGGIGAGKSELLAYIEGNYSCKVILADKVAHQVEEPGQKCYEELVALLGKYILSPDGTIDKVKMAEKIFTDKSVLEKVNGIIHPAVKEYIMQEIRDEREKGKLDFLFVEAALLIEDGYGQIVDELWYIYSEIDIRRNRLKKSRAYSDEKIDSILKGQLSDEEFRQHCRVVIDNNGTLADTCKQIDKKLEEYLCQRQ
ncbi:MAG: dephospho-CoA kinase [Lachnospiraceae bacterium]|nr:dephospho-CoA kinase [Lachnospiraceae bacterium]